MTSLPSSPRHASPRQRWIRRIGNGIIAILIWLIAQIFITPVNQLSSNLVDRGRNYITGEDHPIELQPICTNLNQGRIVAPPAEKNAAFHYRCARSKQMITRGQIEQRCITQWGRNAKLVLRDPDSASGWKCHTPGWLH